MNRTKKSKVIKTYDGKVPVIHGGLASEDDIVTAQKNNIMMVEVVAT